MGVGFTGGGGVDWAKTTAGTLSGNGGDTVSINGSGYVIGGHISGQADGSADSFGKPISIDVTLDSTTEELVYVSVIDGPATGSSSVIWRFDNSLDMTVNGDPDVDYVDGRVTYVLD